MPSNIWPIRIAFPIGSRIPKLRPGDAGANTVADHFTVLEIAVAPLPAEIGPGHHLGDDPAIVQRKLQVRTDSAGCSTRFASGCRSRNIGFAVAVRRWAQQCQRYVGARSLACSANDHPR